MEEIYDVADQLGFRSGDRFEVKWTIRDEDDDHGIEGAAVCNNYAQVAGDDVDDSGGITVWWSATLIQKTDRMHTLTDEDMTEGELPQFAVPVVKVPIYELKYEPMQEHGFDTYSVEEVAFTSDKMVLNLLTDEIITFRGAGQPSPPSSPSPEERETAATMAVGVGCTQDEMITVINDIMQSSLKNTGNKVAHPKDNDSRSGIVMDKRKVDNDDIMQRSSNNVTKKPKKNSPPVVTAATKSSCVSMSPLLLAKLDAVLVDPSLPGESGGDIVNLSTNVTGADHSSNASIGKSPDAAAAIDKSTVPEADPTTAFNMSSVQDSIERLEQLKVQSLELRDFARAGKIMTSLGIVHSKLAEVKCCKKGIKAAAEAEEYTKAGQLKSERDIMRVQVMQALRNADTNETIVNSSVTDREVRVSIIMEKGSKSSNIMSGFDKVSREISDGLERLDELKKNSAICENFGTIGKVNKSLGAIYAKLAEFKAAGEQVEMALREAGDELFGKEQMSIYTTKVKSEF